jgi:putative aldouronate transport system substrate-binding protein
MATNQLRSKTGGLTMKKVLLAWLLILALVVTACSGATEITESTQTETADTSAEIEQAEADQQAAEEAADQAQAELDVAKAAEEQAKVDAEKAAAEKAEAERLLAEAKTEEEKAAAEKLLAEKLAAEQAAAATLAKAAAEKAAADQVAADKAAAQKVAATKLTAEKTTRPVNKNLTAPGTYPIVKEKVTLRILVQDNGRIENLKTNTFVKQYEEKTNVRIEWEVVPQKQANEKLNLMLASGDLPDAIMKFGITPPMLKVYGELGGFLRLNDIIEEQGVLTKKLLAEKPLVKKAITSTDGSIFSLPNYTECYHCSMPTKLWIYKPWLDKLGLKVPTTTDEFYLVLKAFKTKDPNGNGKADEIPFAGATIGSRVGIEMNLLNSFLYYDIDRNKRLIIKNGKIEASYTQPEYKEGLKYLNKLYSEGLIAPESFTQDTNQLRKMGENPGTPILGTVAGNGPATFAQIGGNRWYDYVAVPPLKGPTGYVKTPYNSYFTFSPSGFVITSATKHPEVALRWAEGFYDEQIMMLARFGQEGVGWRKSKPGEISLDGGQAKWTRLEAFGNVQNDHLAQINHDHQTLEHRNSESAVNRDRNLEVILYEATKNLYEPFKQSEDKILPIMWFNEQQSGKLQELETTIDLYIQEMLARFVTGDANIDKEWDNYINTLKKMDIQTMLDIYTKVYNSKK